MKFLFLHKILLHSCEIHKIFALTIKILGDTIMMPELLRNSFDFRWKHIPLSKMVRKGGRGSKFSKQNVHIVCELYPINIKTV